MLCKMEGCQVTCKCCARWKDVDLQMLCKMEGWRPINAVRNSRMCPERAVQDGRMAEQQQSDYEGIFMVPWKKRNCDGFATQFIISPLIS
ncbi:hypothetical protein HNY73_013888 [Argiope bruennichi]|uniref:Uncharacterized protein n=1 Tax=Argiope bruennichi TaxID=94029 RepID=A0A8T0ERF4_ARGBR|nr:hypothetical protein HNY73_013888 [Argiope bruennichi]